MSLVKAFYKGSLHLPLPLRLPPTFALCSTVQKAEIEWGPRRFAWGPSGSTLFCLGGLALPGLDQALAVLPIAAGEAILGQGKGHVPPEEQHQQVLRLAQGHNVPIVDLPLPALGGGEAYGQGH